MCTIYKKECHAPCRWVLISLELIMYNHFSLWCMASAKPELWLPSQPNGITARWPVPNDTAWWQKHMCVNNLPDNSMTGIPSRDHFKSHILTITTLGHTRNIPTGVYLFNGLLFGNTQVSWYQKGKTNLDLVEQQTVSGSGISWVTCKSAPWPRQITTPAPQEALTVAQSTVSNKHVIYTVVHKKRATFIFPITLANIDGFS